MKRVSDSLVTKQVSPPFLWDHSGVTGQVKNLSVSRLRGVDDFSTGVRCASARRGVGMGNVKRLAAGVAVPVVEAMFGGRADRPGRLAAGT